MRGFSTGPGVPGLADAAGSPYPNVQIGESRQTALLQQNVAAALAGGIIAASGKPHTPAQAVKVMRAVLAELDAKAAPD